jgi:DNA ligase-1
MIRRKPSGAPSHNMLLHDLVQVSRQVSGTASRSDKVRLLAGLLKRVAPSDRAIAIGLLSGELRQGRIGLGPATAFAAVPNTAVPLPVLTLAVVDAAFDRIARATGVGSATERARLVGDLLASATADEQDFLLRALLGELRQGALAGLMVEALGQAGEIPADEVRRALMMTGDLGAVACLALAEGQVGLRRLAIQLFRPLKPMLAHPARDVAEALSQFGKAAFEYKLDGARIQVHKLGQEVRVFSRQLNPVTDAVPEIVEAVRMLPLGSAILDGEAVALRRDGTAHPFQITMRRFGRKLDVEALRRDLPLRAFFFDCLYLDGEPVLDRPAADRFAALASILPAELLIPRLVSDRQAEAERFLREAIDRGHEGIMAKALAATYEAGARGRAWLKIKQAVTLDLVVLAAEWGHGRRRGWLSNLHLGARDPETGGFVMLGKTFKGMTDDMLAWQTNALKELAVAGDARTVQVRPGLVVEVAFNEVQASPRYPGGLALRFARVKRYRPEKRPDQADTIETVRRLYEQRYAAEESDRDAVGD